MRWRKTITALAASMSVWACLPQEQPVTTENKEELVNCTLTLSVMGEESKTLLSSDGIENRVTDITVAVYRDSKLFYTAYHDSPPQKLDLLLHKDKNFTVNVLANMGDMRGQFPREISRLSEIVYVLPSYTEINAKGIPMVGSVVFNTQNKVNTHIGLERMFAKVTANLHCKWPGGRIQAARLMNMNGKLTPFTPCYISDTEDIYSGDVECDFADSPEATLVLYVPENMQGEIGSVSAPDEKAPDKNSDVYYCMNGLTYLEVDVVGSSLYQGTITYRNCLGNNATDSFDIERNTSYTWNIDYYEDSLSKDEWKYENALTDTRYLDVDDYIYVMPGQIVSLADYLDSNMDPSTLSWAPLNSEIAFAIINIDNLSLNNFAVRPGTPGGMDIPIAIYPTSNRKDSLEKIMTIRIREPLNLHLTRTDSNDIFPYNSICFMSEPTLTLEEAISYANSLSIEMLPDNSVSALQRWNVGSKSGGYYVRGYIVPTRPGTYKCAAMTDTKIEWMEFEVSTPCISPDVDEVHVDLTGTSTALPLRLCDSAGNSIKDGEYADQSIMSIRMTANSGTDLTITYDSDGGTGYNSTVKYYNVSLRGFSGLTGLDPYNFSFNGLTVPSVASYTYPNGYRVTKPVNIIIDAPESPGSGMDGNTYSYNVDMGAEISCQYVSATPECYPQYMLEWPQRSISVDLTRGGTRNVPSDIQMWKGDKSYITNSRYLPASNGKVTFNEDLKEWGSVYYGKQIRNIYSGESITALHSVVHLYCHYNVFACYDVRQDYSANMGSTWGEMDWNTTDVNGWGCFRASTKNNFSKGGYQTALASLIVNKATDSTPANPVYQGFVSAGDHTYISNVTGQQVAHAEYRIGYKKETDAYNIYYSFPIYIYDYSHYFDPWVILNWRVIAAANKPQFGVKSSGYAYGNSYISAPEKLQDGCYSFSIIRKADHESGKDNLYLDPDNHGYQRLHLFWEDKEGPVTVLTRKLNAQKWPSTLVAVNIVNGWYDPSLYYNATDQSRNGVPKYATKTGMYFFPDIGTYYESDHPFNYKGFNAASPICFDNTDGYMPKPEFLNTVEWFGFGTLALRDLNALRD